MKMTVLRRHQNLELCQLLSLEGPWVLEPHTRQNVACVQVRMVRCVFSQKFETLKTSFVLLLVVTVKLPLVLTKLDVEGRRLPVWTQQRALGRKAWSEAKNRRRVLHRMSEWSRSTHPALHVHHVRPEARALPITSTRSVSSRLCTCDTQCIRQIANHGHGDLINPPQRSFSWLVRLRFSLVDILRFHLLRVGHGNVLQSVDDGLAHRVVSIQSWFHFMDFRVDSPTLNLFR